MVGFVQTSLGTNLQDWVDVLSHLDEYPSLVTDLGFASFEIAVLVLAAFLVPRCQLLVGGLQCLFWCLFGVNSFVCSSSDVNDPRPSRKILVEFLDP